MTSKPTPKADALRALREANASLSGTAKTLDRMDLNDDATARVAALLVRAQHRLATMADPTNPSPDEVLIYDLQRMLAAAFDEGDDYLSTGEVLAAGIHARKSPPMRGNYPLPDADPTTTDDCA